jgi:glycosyltransferase involved in cell wall biosynthesis
MLRPALRLVLARARRWDVEASRRVDHYIANSQLTRERIRRYYGREAHIIHPPVETHRFTPGEGGEVLLVVSELVRHKRVSVALEAARRAGMRIRVAGSGPDRDALEAAYPEAEFLWRAGDGQIAQLYATARALVVPSMEEFGITAVEAQAAGRPVVAPAAGGALETVIDGETGLLAELDNPDSFAQAMRGIDELDFDPANAVVNAERFSVAAFHERLSSFVEGVRGG